MKNTILTLAASLCLVLTAQAHDEGHGPKLSDTGKYGGLVAPVVAKAESSKGAKAKLIHKAELAKSSDGTVRVYLYDDAMKPLDLGQFKEEAQASLAHKKKGKWINTDFKLKKEGKAFIGKMPKPESKPYNIDVVLTQGEKELLTAFDNLD